MRYIPHNYQEFAFEHVVNTPYSGLFLDMGLGKTVVTLTALDRLIYQDLALPRALIIAPKHVTRTVWKQETQKWDHLKHLKVAIVWGSVRQRIAALKTDSDIYVINRENVVWLVKLYQSKFPFPMVILDESSSFKDSGSQRFRALKMVRSQIQRVVLLSGTPAPNSLMDLWSQIFLLDQGERLEKNITGYRERYFSLKNPNEFFSGYKLRPDGAKAIYSKIEDICISMKNRDYLDLPPIIENDVYLQMDDKVQEAYELFEEEQIMAIAEQEITALNAAALSNKLLQFASGAIYSDGKKYALVHDTKLQALDELIEAAQGNPVLIFYAYRHGMERIMQRYPKARKMNGPKDLDDWNAGKIPIMVAHPASAGHGLNMQSGGHIIIWYGLNWSLELYLQAVARLLRQGQTETVVIHRLIMANTMDIDVLDALTRKSVGQEALLAAIKARVDKYKQTINSNTQQVSFKQPANPTA